MNFKTASISCLFVSKSCKVLPIVKRSKFTVGIRGVLCAIIFVVGCCKGCIQRDSVRRFRLIHHNYNLNKELC